MTTFRQTREASLIYTNTESELKRIKNKQRNFIILTIVAFIVAILGIIFLLGALEYANESTQEDIHFSSTMLASYKSADDDLYTSLSDKLLRMHIVANSDSEKDQNVKLLVRNAVVTWISDNMDPALSKELACDFLLVHKDDITEVANKVLEENQMNYKATTELCVSHFPGKVYGDFYLPAGDYDALKVVLGKGEGHNWWCIAFPCLCLYGNAEYEDESGKRSSYDMFEELIGEEDYEDIKVEKVRIDFKCKWLKKMFD